MFEKNLESHLNTFTTAPFLFIGSGMSRRYISTPNWYGLFEEIIPTLKLSQPIEYYNSKANGDLTKLASKLGEDFNEKWWSDPDFEKSREEYSKKTTSEFSPLKFEISKYFSNKERNINIKYKNELNKFKKTNIDGIITTNYDLLLESLFPDFKTIIGQEQLIFSDNLNIGEIYKIHGCITEPESIVVTDRDYEKFNE